MANKEEIILLEWTRDNLKLKLKEIAKEGFSLKINLDKLSNCNEEESIIIKDKESAEKEILSYQNEVIDLNEKISDHEINIRSENDIKNKLQELESLKKQITELNANQSDRIKEREIISVEYIDRKKIVETDNTSLQNEKRVIEKKAEKVESEEKIITKYLTDMRKNIKCIKNGECSILHKECPLKNSDQFKIDLKDQENKYDSLNTKKKNIRNKIMNFYKKIGQIDLKIQSLKWPEEPKPLNFCQDDLNNIYSRIDRINEIQLREKIDCIHNSKRKFEELRSRKDLINNHIKEITEHRDKLSNKMSSVNNPELKIISEKIEIMRSKYTETVGEYKKVVSQITDINK